MVKHLALSRAVRRESSHSSHGEYRDHADGQATGIVAVIQFCQRGARRADGPSTDVLGCRRADERGSLQSFSGSRTIRIKPEAPTAEILKKLPTRCWTSKKRLVESRPFKFEICFVLPPHEAPRNTMVETAEQPPSCYRRRPPGPVQRLRDGLGRLTSLPLRPALSNSAERRFEPLSISPLCLSLAGSISLSPARAYRVWLAATIRAGQLLPLQFVRRFTRR